MSLRYRGQTWELDIPVDGQRLDRPAIADHFHQAHSRAYGYDRPDHPVELVSLKVTATGHTQKPSLGAPSDTRAGASPAFGERTIYMNGTFVNCPIYQRESLALNAKIHGPAVIEEFGSFTLLFPSWSALADQASNLLLERDW
jgi:N-methylhydantoinase A